MTKVSVVVLLQNDQNGEYAALDALTHQSLKETEVICTEDGNAGLAQAKGNYVLFLHEDDILLSTALEKLYQEAETASSDIVAFSGVNVEIQESETGKESVKNVETCQRSGEYSEVLSGKDMMCLLVGRNAYYPSVSLQLYRRAYLLEKSIRFSDSFENAERVFTFCSYLEAERVCAVGDIYLYHRMEADIRIQELEKLITELEKSLDDTKKQLKEVSDKKKKLESSHSYRIGKKVTSIPRKVKKTFGNNQEKK